MGLLDFSGIVIQRELTSTEKNRSVNDGPARIGIIDWEAEKRETSLGECFSQFCSVPRRKHRRSLKEVHSEINCVAKKCTVNEDYFDKQARISEGSIGRIQSSRKRPFSFKRTSPLQTIFLLAFIMDSLPGIDPSLLSNTICKYLDYKNECEKELQLSLQSLNQSNPYCGGEFDNYMCWPHAEAGKMATARCPDFFKIMNNTKVGYRYCHPNGSWYKEFDPYDQKFVIWRHIGACSPFENETEIPEDNEAEEALLTNLRIMYTVGYGLSLVCLVLALSTLAFFKNLHCTRNYIHMNLMVSFILRYIVILVKDSVLLSHYDLNGLENVGTLNYDQLRQYCDDDNSIGWRLTRCRLVITLMHYAITVNYFWLLAEGLYLQMLLVFAMSENKYFAGFMVFGWGAPWISVIIWVTMRVNFENSGCWDMNDMMHIWWIIRAPIIISIVINFFIFINIVRLIVSKLQAHNMARTDIKLRLAKSTLALIPLLGIHYIVFLALTEEVTNTNATPMHLKLAFDMFLSSIQGTLVSVLYCFLNNEVRTEVRRAWDIWRSQKGLPKGSNIRKGSATMSANNSTQVMQLSSRHSTNGGDVSLQENCHWSNSTRSNGNNRKSSIAIQNNGSGLSETKLAVVRNVTAMKTFRGEKDMNGNAQTKECDGLSSATAIPMPVVKGEKTNGDIECEANEPFLYDNEMGAS